MKKITKATIWADSILKGVMYDEVLKRYYVYKENGLQLTAETSGIKLENNSRFGLTSTKAKRLMESEKIDSDICLIELGGNDCDYKWSEIALDPTLDHKPITSIDEYKTSIREMINYVRSQASEPVLVSLPPIDSEKFLNWVSKGLNKENIMKWLGSTNRIYATHESYNLALLDVAREMNCYVINLREEFLTDSSYQEMICLDGIHLNERGQKKIFNCFESYLDRLSKKQIA